MPEEDPRIIELRNMREKAQKGGGEKRIARQHAKGKLTARERITLLSDPNTFQELEPFIIQRADHLDSSDDPYLGDGVITGSAKINGRTVYLYAQDFTIMGGSLGEMQSRKIVRAMDLAVQSGCPIIGLIDSGGARIQEGVRSLGGYAEIFRRNAQYSGVVPQISLILGPCAGGAAYSPAVTDMIIMVDKHSYMFLTGPEVIKSVTGEVIDFESLGGAEVHLAVSGIAHITTPSEQDALATCRSVIGYLPSNNIENPPFADTGDNPERMEESLNHLVPANPATPYSMHEAIEKIIDSGSFLELQSRYACNAIVGLARLGGNSVGIVSQEPNVLAGIVDIDAADKIARFVRFCDCYNIPIITFVDSPGFLPGVDQEHRGIIRHGAKILYAYAESTVPKISVVTRKAYGGAYVVLSSKYMGTDVTFAWPSAEIAVMGPEGAANILYRKQIDAAEDPETERANLTEEYRKQIPEPLRSRASGLY